MLGVGHRAEADLPEGQALEVVLLEQCQGIVADLAIQHLIGRLAVREDVGQIEGAQRRLQAREVGVAGQLDIDGAAAHAGDHLLVTAEHAVAEDVDGDLAIRAFLDQLGEAFGRLLLGIGGRGRVRQLEHGGCVRGAHWRKEKQTGEGGLEHWRHGKALLSLLS